MPPPPYGMPPAPGPGGAYVGGPPPPYGMQQPAAVAPPPEQQQGVGSEPVGENKAAPTEGPVMVWNDEELSMEERRASLPKYQKKKTTEAAVKDAAS